MRGLYAIVPVIVLLAVRGHCDDAKPPTPAPTAPVPHGPGTLSFLTTDSGDPLAGWMLDLYDGNEGSHAVTARDGSFTVPGLWWLGRITATPPDPDALRRREMARCWWLGRVDTIQRVDVPAHRALARLWWDGLFTGTPPFDSIRRRRAVLRYRTDGASERLRFTLHSDEFRLVDGRVLDAAGAPLRLAWVRFTPVRGGQAVETATDFRGVFEERFTQDAEYDVSVARAEPRSPWVAARRVRGGDYGVVLRVP